MPTSSGSGRTCSFTTYAGTAATYAHAGKDAIYAVSVRVQVCDGTLDTRSLCTKYGSYHKPEGLLQKNAKKIRYGLFSYLTETGQQRQGGVMRARQKLIGPVVSGEKPYPDKAARIAGIDNPEWDSATGVFIDNPDDGDATATNTNIGNCGSSAPDSSQCVVKYSGVINYLNRFGQILTGQSTLKSFDNLTEMYYTALRYLRGLANISSFSDLTKLASSDLSGSGALAKYQNADGLPVINDWYKTGANASVTAWTASTPARSTGTDGDPMLYQCQTSVVLGIGDTHTNNEDDTADLTKDSTTTNTQAADGGTWRGYTEFNSGGNGRGNLAGLAYWAHLNDLRTDVPNTEVANKTQGSRRGQIISTFWVDVVEQNDLYATTTNQFYNATKYGGYNIPVDDWNANGNATRHDAAWFNSNQATWTSATQTVKVETGLGGSGDYYQPNNMYLANNGQKMIDGLNAAFSKIVEDLAGSGASLAANSTKLDTGTTTYQAVYYTGDWRGDVKAFPVSGTGTISTTAVWEASKRLPAASARNIVTCTGSGTCSSSVSFKTTTTFDTKNYLCANSAACGSGEADSLINYLRGTSVSTLRLRSTALGDIVNSQPVFSGSPNPNLYNGRNFASAYRTFANHSDVKTRKKMIYVAANDGMVHAFSAEATSFTATIDSVSTNVLPGQEVFAYLPRAVIKSGLRKISAADYGDTTNPHQFWNDGELVVADVECATACPNAVGGWATVLVGTTGRGPSKAVYALDVTDPTDIQLLWERSSADGVTGSDYIGQVVGKPVIARVSSAGGWAVLMGNGYNSTQNAPALLQFNITDGTLSVYTTGGSADDGLAPPAVWIKDANVSSNVSSEAYAGDLNGNVWGFTLTASGGGAGTKLFIAKDRDGSGFKLQPITSGMLVAKNPEDNQVWVFFGTGSFLSSFKATDGLQTWYGLIVQGADKVSCTGSSSCSARSALRQRSIVAESAASNTSLAARAISASTASDMVGKKGWFIDLKLSGGSEKGERMITSNQFYGYLLVGTTRLPTTGDPCNPSGSGWVMAIYPFTGAPPSTAFFDVNSSGIFTDDRVIAADGTSYVAAGVGFGAIPNNPIFVGHTMMMSFDNATTGSLNVRPTGAGVAARLSWRELVGQ
ncbi:pilus assembly protein [Stagnimonas aquatica]|uniref:Pilus assembly protein n=1 Tax=Stagnimonas aquatica TaxID=2689987 RepID=A0A3N0VA27_9GAMM|nr:pilus assembly protein [Stagnimonas aquatica]